MRRALGHEEEATEEEIAGSLLRADDGATLLGIARMIEAALKKG